VSFARAVHRARPALSACGLRVLGVVSTLCVSLAGHAVEDLPETAAAALRAQGHLAAARSALAAGHLEQAKDEATAGLALAPGDIALRQELARIDAARSGQPMADGARPDPAVQRASLLADLRRAQQRAELLSQSGDAAGAVRALEAVRLGLQQYGTPTDVAAVDALVATYRAHGVQSADIQAISERQTALSQAQARTQDDERQQGGAFAERMARIRQVHQRGHEELALGQARQLVRDYPTRPEAEALFQEILTAAHRQRRLDNDAAALDAKHEMAQRMRASLIPSGDDGMPMFPDDWLRRAERRTLTLSADAVAEPAWKEALRDTLARRVSVDFQAMSGTDCLQALARQAGVNLVIDPALMAGEERLVTLAAANLRLDNALNWITRQMETKWFLTDGAIYVGGEAAAEPVMRAYEVQALTFQGRDQPGPVISFQAGGGAGGGLSLFGATPAAGPTVTADEVVDLIKSAVSPATWENPAYSITIRANTLFVTAPEAIHGMLAEFVRAQEQTHNLMVKVDARWLELKDGVVEEIGVDWGGTNGLLRDLDGASSGYVNQQENSLWTGKWISSLPSVAVQSAPALLGSGLTLSAAYLGAQQLSGIFTAVERDNRGRFLVGQGLSTLNGVRSHVFYGTQIAYISDYEIVAENLDPKIEVLNVGTSLDIRPLVSADRKYVTMEFRPITASATLFTEIIRANTANATQNVFNQLTGSQPLSIADILAYLAGQPFPIELPNVSVREASTSIQVPDRASLLVGGFTKAIEQHASTGIPFLGNIPFLGRLFSKRGQYVDNGKLFLLATVTIISYDELEDQL